MGEIVNLNRVRKALAKKQGDLAARVNRARTGRTKAEQEQERLERERARRQLDDRRLE